MSSAAIPSTASSVPSTTVQRQFDQRYVAPLLITCVLLVAHLSAGVLESPWKTAAAIVAAMLTEIVLSRLLMGKWPHLASAYVTGISVAKSWSGRSGSGPTFCAASLLSFPSTWCGLKPGTC